MILGIGQDVLDIRRIERIMQRHGQRFVMRCFTALEQEKTERRRQAGTHMATYAKRFAAKEACAKALGTGFNQGVYLKDIGVVNDQYGRPTIELTNGALEKLWSITPAGLKPAIHVSLSDEPPWAQAYVVIEAFQDYK